MTDTDKEAMEKMAGIHIANVDALILEAGDLADEIARKKDELDLLNKKLDYMIMAINNIKKGIGEK